MAAGATVIGSSLLSGCLGMLQDPTTIPTQTLLAYTEPSTIGVFQEIWKSTVW